MCVMSQNGPSDSPRYEAVVLKYKHSAGNAGDIVPDRGGILVLAGVARRLEGNVSWEAQNEGGS